MSHWQNEPALSIRTSRRMTSHHLHNILYFYLRLKRWKKKDNVGQQQQNKERVFIVYGLEDEITRTFIGIE